MTFLGMASQRLKAETAKARKLRRKEKAKRLAKARQIVTEAGEALTLPVRWTLKTVKAKLQAELNAAVRERDGAVCISSGKILDKSEWGAGHLFAVGPFPSVRFHPLNIHSQASYDNCYLNGNHAAYSAAHIRKYGLATFEALAAEARRPRQWTAAELYELLTILRRDGLRAYTERYFAMTNWTVERAA